MQTRALLNANTHVLMEAPIICNMNILENVYLFIENMKIPKLKSKEMEDQLEWWCI